MNGEHVTWRQLILVGAGLFYIWLAFHPSKDDAAAPEGGGE